MNLPKNRKELADCDADYWNPVIAHISERCGFQPSGIQRLGGSCVVHRVGDVVIKLHEPWNHGSSRVETEALQLVQKRLPVRTPELLHVGDIDGWNYLVMRRVPGVPLSDVWPTLSRENKSVVLQQLGIITAELHRLPLQNPDSEMRIDWQRFTRQQVEQCQARQCALGLAKKWSHQFPEYLETLLPEVFGGPELVLLHTEIMGANVLLKQFQSEWRVSGLIDFEPCMIGQPEYEFAAIAAFLTSGDPHLLRAFLLSYGYLESALDTKLRARIMVWMLLHRFANVPLYLRTIAGSETARSWLELEQLWCGTECG